MRSLLIATILVFVSSTNSFLLIQHKLKTDEVFPVIPKPENFLNLWKLKIKQSTFDNGVKHNPIIDILEKITGKKYEDWPAYEVIQGILRLYKRKRNL